MLKTLKFKGPENKFFFISDNHHGHNRDFLYGKRGVNSVEEHDEMIVAEWNNVVDMESTVFSLGDHQFNDSTGEKFLNLYRRLNFKECYVLQGNHTSGQRQNYIDTIKGQFPNSVIDNKLQFEVYPLTKIIDGYKKLIFLPVYAEIQINSDLISLCHYPIISHNDQGHGSLMLCGHCHNNLAETNVNTGKGRRLDCSWEGLKRPWHLGEIKNHLKDRDLDVRDHHGNP